MPDLFPALLTGFALAFARAIGEYGSVVFISGNMPMRTEIAPLLIITKLEQYDYAGATAIAVVMLAISFVLLLGDQRPAALERRGRREVAADDVPRSRTNAPPIDRAALVRWMLIAVALPFSALFLVLPLVAVFAEAFAKGVGAISPRSSSPTPRGAPTDAADRAIAVPLQPRVRHRGRMGHRQVRVSAARTSCSH